jgi:predicted enzyme related to lactoylglutathione lyase
VSLGRLDEVVVDCLDPHALALFWQRVLGGDVVVQSDEWVAVTPPSGITVSFQRVPEPKTVKNRVHLDVMVDDYHEAATKAEAFGAHRVGAPQVDELGGFQVMHDPEGNEFCFIVGPTPIDPAVA